MNKNKKIILTLLGYLISLSLLIVTFKDISFKKVVDYLREIDLFLVFLALLRDIPTSQSDLVAALIISLHFLTVILDVLVGGIIILIYKRKDNIKFVNNNLLW